MLKYTLILTLMLCTVVAVWYSRQSGIYAELVTWCLALSLTLSLLVMLLIG